MSTASELDPYSAVPFSPAWNNTASVAIKRVVDVLATSIAMIVLFPMYLALAIAVKLSSPGPVFYRWHVVGKGGRYFVAYKFRSMITDADRLKGKLEQFNEMKGPVFKISDDPRITALGKWMRRYSLDELPQFYSVFKGDMSLVGPRPPLISEFIRFTDHQKLKLAVKPGITCLWQVNGRNEVTDFNEWVKLDLEYIRRWSLSLDFWILLKTVYAVFAGSGR